MQHKPASLVSPPSELSTTSERLFSTGTRRVRAVSPLEIRPSLLSLPALVLPQPAKSGRSSWPLVAAGCTAGLLAYGATSWTCEVYSAHANALELPQRVQAAAVVQPVRPIDAILAMNVPQLAQTKPGKRSTRRAGAALQPSAAERQLLANAAVTAPLLQSAGDRTRLAGAAPANILPVRAASAAKPSLQAQATSAAAAVSRAKPAAIVTTPSVTTASVACGSHDSDDLARAIELATGLDLTHGSSTKGAADIAAPGGGRAKSASGSPSSAAARGRIAAAAAAIAAPAPAGIGAVVPAAPARLTAAASPQRPQLWAAKTDLELSPAKSHRAAIARISVQGSLPASTVRRSLERIRSQLSQCMEHCAETAASCAPGRWHTEISIDETGHARQPRVSGAGSNEAVARCLKKTAARLATSAPDTGTVRASWDVQYDP